MNRTVLDELFAENAVPCQAEPITITPDELAHVVGTQEPVREHPDDRGKILIRRGWLTVEQILIDLTEEERAKRVTAVQQAGRSALKQEGAPRDTATRQQVRWLMDKTRAHESKLQIGQRVWLALVLYSLGYRGLAFDAEGQISWSGGKTGRIGLGADAVIDVAWEQENKQVVTASFRQPDGTITRGKGRQRWHIYRMTLDPAAQPLFDRRAKPVDESIALVVASETFASLPQLPRSFYGGDDFQQACIDAQDGGFAHILVLSPAHGVLSLDDTVSSEITWDEVIERHLWLWQIQAAQRLGAILAKQPPPKDLQTNWWAWLNPESIYRLTIFGSGFAAHFLVDHLLNARNQAANSYPQIVLTEQRPGYDAGDLDEDFFAGLGPEYDDDQASEQGQFTGLLAEDIEQIFEWANDFAELVNVYVPPTGEIWNLASDEALIPVRLLTDADLPMEDLLDLLTDITLLLEKPVPINLIVSAEMAVSTLLQVTHNLVHNDNAAIDEVLNQYPEIAVRNYVDQVLQEPSQEDRLCAILTLAEQMQVLAISLPTSLIDQLLIWLQTYVASHLRRRLVDDPSDRAH